MVLISMNQYLFIEIYEASVQVELIWIDLHSGNWSMPNWIMQ